MPATACARLTCTPVHPPAPRRQVYAFSSENWRRAPAEVAALLALMERVLAAEVAELAAAGVRLRFIGELDRLPAPLLRRMSRSVCWDWSCARQDAIR